MKGQAEPAKKRARAEQLPLEYRGEVHYQFNPKYLPKDTPQHVRDEAWERWKARYTPEGNANRDRTYTETHAPLHEHGLVDLR